MKFLYLVPVNFEELHNMVGDEDLGSCCSVELSLFCLVVIVFASLNM